MRKTIILSVLLFLIPMLCFSGPLQEKQLAVIVKNNVVNTEEVCSGNCIISANWTGTDILNTGAGTGHVFSASSNAPDAYFVINSTGKGWNGGTHSALFSYTTSIFRSLKHSGFSAVDQFASRVYACPTALGVPSGQAYVIMRQFNGITPTNQLRISNVGGTLGVDIRYTDAAAVTRNTAQITPISTSSCYWFELIHLRNTTANLGVIAKVWASDGTTLVGSVAGNVSYSTHDFGIDNLEMGLIGATSTTNTVYFSNYAAYGGATQGFIGARTK